MGIVLTAAVYFIFGLIIGLILMTIGIGGIVYDNYKYNDPKSAEAIHKLYDVGKRFFDRR